MFKQIAVLVLTVASHSLLGQSFGEITGTVSDFTGAVISGAVVTVTNPPTNQVRSATTKDVGNYSVPFLAPGLSDVRAENSGFKTRTCRGIVVEVSAVARINLATRTRNADLSLSRNINIMEGHTLQFRWESFNSTNHPKLECPGHRCPQLEYVRRPNISPNHASNAVSSEIPVLNNSGAAVSMRSHAVRRKI